MRKIVVLAACLLGAALVPAASAVADTTTDSSTVHAHVRDVNGGSLGTVTISTVSNGTKLLIQGRLSGLSAGFHGFHIHSVGICNPTATDPNGTVVPFFTAGGHLNPGGTGHGTHAGDLPSLKVAADGRTLAVVETDSVTLAQIFDADGAAFIVHAAPDNFAHIPARYSAAGVPGPDAATLATGDAGARFACGVIHRH